MNPLTRWRAAWIAPFALALACTNTAPAPQAQLTTAQERPLTYPETRREDVTVTAHGLTLPDPYQWLERVDSPEVRAWMKAQDDLTTQRLDALPQREALARRFAQLYYVDAVSAPRRHGERYFLYRRTASQEKSVVMWRDGESGEERVLIDPNTLSEDGSVALGGIFPTHDGSRVAYKLKPNNADEATLYVMDVATGKTSDIDVIEGAKYAGPSWLPDGSGFYYTWLPTDPTIPTEERPGLAEVRFHRLGSDPSQDPVVVAASRDPQQFIGASLSREGGHLLLYRQRGWDQTELSIHTMGADPAKATFAPIAPGVSANFEAYVWRDHIYLKTDHEAARGRMLRAPLSNPTLAAAQEIVPEHPDAVLEDFTLIGDRLVLTYLQRANSALRVHSLSGALEREIALPTLGDAGGVTGDPDRPDAYFTFNAFTIPRQIYRTDVGVGTSTLWASVNVPIDPSPYQVEQVSYPSRDGTPITMFVVSRKDAPRDGSTPFLLNGYGGFNVNMTSYFRASIYPWLEAGGGYAVPNLRGGGEYGEAWHQAGMLANKQNVFDDFIAAAEFLVAKGYTQPERLAISGGSNGGLLVGAAMTQRPELFGAVVCAVPLLDMVRYHLFGSGKTWIPEYGDPEDPEQLKVLAAYSPYHRVKQGTRYPATLLLSADSDDRVDPMHARKMAAALQHANTGSAPILLSIEQNAGHGGADMVKKWVERDSQTYAFLMDRFKMRVAP